MKSFKFIDHVDFADEVKLAAFCEPMLGFDELLTIARTRKVDVHDMCSVPLLTKAQEQYLFRQYNALKYAANASQNEQLCHRVQAVKEVLYMCNMRLVVDFLKKQYLTPAMFEHRFSDCCDFMMNALEKFNYSFGFKFSTYCTWALVKNLIRLKEMERRHQQIIYMDPVELRKYDTATNEPGFQNIDRDDALAHLFRQANLHKRQIKVIMECTAVFANKKRTLKEVGKDLKVHRERVRQIKVAGLKKLRKVLEEDCTLLEVG